MNYFEQLAENFAHQLIRPRRYNYSEQLLENFFIENPHLTYRFAKALNKRQQLLQTLLVKKLINNAPSKRCIIYAHGLGSNKLQVLPILKHLRNFPDDICSFDFSGSGKSEGKFTSYGLREQDDVTAILRWLDQTQNYQQYILWGRSMGSVAIILSQGLLLNTKVRSIILDSPFSSFEKVSLQIASKKSFIPELFLQPLLSYLKEYFHKKSQFNPFTVNVVETIKLIDRKIMFIYSKNDSVVSYTHSMKLKVNCKFLAHEIVIVQDHNMQRSKDTHLRAYNFIVKNSHQQNLPTRILQTPSNIYLDQTIRFDKLQCQTNRGKSINRNRGISLTSKQSFKDKENVPLQSNRIAPRKSTTGNSSNNAKINLVITQSLIMNRKNSVKDSMHHRQTKIKPSSIKLGRSNCQHNSFTSLRKLSPKSLAQQPSTLLSLNSIDTIESNNQQIYRDKINNRITDRIIYTNSSQAASIELGNHRSKQIMNPSHSKKNFKYQNHNHNQIKYIQKLNSFYSASFMDQNINLLCSINSICLNRKKNKENHEKQTHKIENYFKQNQQTNLQFKQTPQTSSTKQKNTGSSVKRPSIQLRRKNRFVF